MKSIVVITNKSNRRFFNLIQVRCHFEIIAQYFSPFFSSDASSSPFSDSNLFTSSHIITILIDLLLSLERQCYLLSNVSSDYQLSEYVRLFISDICLALINCSSTKKLLKPFAQIHQQQFNLLCKFLRTQMPQEIYTTLEPKLISCCVKDS